MGPPWFRVLEVASLAVFAFSAAVHVLSFVPGSGVSMAVAWPLHLAAMAVAIPAIVVLARRMPKPPPRGRGQNFVTWMSESNAQGRRSMSGVFGLLPKWARAAFVAVVAYAIVNFFVFLGLMEGGTAASSPQGYYLHSHGQKVRDLTPAEYARFRRYEVRGFSGHWMVFSLLPALFFRYAAPRLGAVLSGPPPAPTWG